MRVIFLALILLHSFGCSTVVRTTLPFNDLPAPGGPFMVGTGIETWEDTSRHETFTDAPTTKGASSFNTGIRLRPQPQFKVLRKI